MPTDLDRAYLAGLIDGEGSIHIVMMNRQKIYLSPRVAIGMTELDCVRWAFKTFPGGRLYLDVTVAGENNRNQNRVDWTGTQAEPLLKEVYPFLKLKAPQAEIVFKLREMQRTRQWGFAAGQKKGDRRNRPQHLVDEMLDCYLRCQRLNRRGKAA